MVAKVYWFEEFWLYGAALEYAVCLSEHTVAYACNVSIPVFQGCVYVLQRYLDPGLQNVWSEVNRVVFVAREAVEEECVFNSVLIYELVLVVEFPQDELVFCDRSVFYGEGLREQRVVNECFVFPICVVVSVAREVDACSCGFQALPRSFVQVVGESLPVLWAVCFAVRGEVLDRVVRFYDVVFDDVAF